MGILVDISIKIKDGKTALDVVSVESFKQYAYEDRGRDDLIAELINAAYERLQRYCGVVFLRSEISAKYKKLDASDSLLYANGATEITRTELSAGITTVQYEAGFEAVPEWVGVAIKKQAAYDIEHLGDERVNASMISSEVKAFLKPFRRIVI